MLGYVVTEPLILKDHRQYKSITPVKSLTEASIDSVQLEAAEFDRVKTQLKEKFTDEEIQEKLRLARDEEIAQWPHFPPRLGRVSLGLIEKAKTFDHQNEKNPLRQQLKLLRERHPHKKHFRFAIVNGFGGNLGDNLIGITAFRLIAKVLAAELPHFSVDILYGWQTNPACRDLLAHEPYIQNVFFSGLPLSEFGQYDAHFDIAHLILYPQYDAMPTVDWYTWWLGLEPEEIDAEQKRNRLTFPYTSWQAVESLLRGTPGKRILFCHRASVHLRTVPPKQVRRLITELLNADESYTLILDIGLEMMHPRLLDLNGKIDSPDKLKALIAQVDGLITIDSFAQHVADATATPSVLLSVALPLSHYPYYPHMQGILVPGAEKLPAWKRVKTSEEEWAKMEPDYVKAWKKLKGKVIWQALIKKIEERSTTLQKAPVQFNFAEHSPRARFTRLHQGAGNVQTIEWVNEEAPLAWQNVEKGILRLGKALLRPGCVVVHAAPACSKVPVLLAEVISPRGQYYIWEPRRLFAQTQAANFMLAGLDNLHLYQTLPAKHESEQIALVEIDPYSEINPIQPGNAYSQGLVDVSSLDTVPLSMCQLLLLHPPLPYTEVLAGAHNLLEQHKPFVIMGPLPQEEAGAACKPLLQYNYELWADNVGENHREAACFLIVAVPPGHNVNMQGFIKVEMNKE